MSDIFCTHLDSTKTVDRCPHRKIFIELTHVLKQISYYLTKNIISLKISQSTGNKQTTQIIYKKKDNNRGKFGKLFIATSSVIKFK